MISERASVRFWSKVEKTDACWLWTGQLSPSGYGKFAVRSGGARKFWRAHRLSWALENGSDPGELLVCHRCDMPACVNPAHLFLGTSADNRRDCMEKGRQHRGPHPFSERRRRGSEHYNASLNEAAVVEMRELYGSGISQSSIALRFSVTQATVSAAVTGRRWGHVPGAHPKLNRSEAGRRNASGIR